MPQAWHRYLEAYQKPEQHSMVTVKQNTYKSVVELVTEADTEKMHHKGSGA